MDKPRIVIDGLYGIQSYGDDAMLLAFMGNVSRRLPGASFTVLSRHPEQLRARYAVEAINNLDHPQGVEPRGYWFYGFNPGQPREHIERIRQTIAGADLLVIGGGNLLLDVTDDWLRGPIAWHWFSSQLAAMHRVPYMLYANSIGPFRTEWGRIRSGHIVRGAAAVTVRDEESMQCVRDMGGPMDRTLVLPDPAFGIEPNVTGAEQILERAGWKVSSKSPRLAVSVRDLSWLPDESAARRYCESIRNLASRLVQELEATLLFVPQCSYDGDAPEADDRCIARRIVEGMPGADRCIVLDGQYSADEVMGLYALVDAAIVTRLHGAVFAAVARKPFVGIDYLPKVKGFMRHVDMEAYAVSLEELADLDRMTARVSHLLEERESVAARLDQAVIRTSESAQQHFDMVVDVLKERSDS